MAAYGPHADQHIRNNRVDKIIRLKIRKFMQPLYLVTLMTPLRTLEVARLRLIEVAYAAKSFLEQFFAPSRHSAFVFFVDFKKPTNAVTLRHNFHKY